MIYVHNNPAKEWILHQVAKHAGSDQFRVCDFACGTGNVWKQFLLAHPHIEYVGFDFNERSIASAKGAFESVANASLCS